MTLDLKELREEAEEYTRLGGFANAIAWVQACPPSSVRELLDLVKELREASERLLMACESGTDNDEHPARAAAYAAIEKARGA
jgi:hypothetical protein